ncbi:coiled-coil domain-containing protein 82-like [Ptychodera flava]|uniref:coiled-coil domain-containing protein 82-like n=1 Tax=Ptychodera flava TaxID=63121 RepID=UPI003969DE47
MSSRVKRRVLSFNNQNGYPLGRDSGGQPTVQDSHGNASCTDEEGERPQEQLSTNDLRNYSINPKTRKRSRLVSTYCGNNDSRSDSCWSVINESGNIALSSKRPRRSQTRVNYEEHESESESEMEDVNDTQNVAYNSATRNGNVQNLNRKSRRKTQRRNRLQAKKNTMKCLIEKGMQSHGDKIAYIWMQDGSTIHKYKLLQTTRLYRKTKSAKRYGGKYEARYQAISGWKPYNGSSKECLPEVVEVTSWEVMAGKEVGYEDYKSYLECIIKVALDEDFLENIRQNNYENGQYIQAFEKINSMLENFMNKIRSSAWKPDFMAIMERCPSKTCENIIKTSLRKKICEVCKRRESIASSIVQFEGPKYDPKTLKEFSEEDNKRSFKIGGECFQRTDIYHNLRHYHFDLLQKCTKKVEKVMYPGADDDDVVYDILTKECRWVEDEHYLFNWLLSQSYQRFKQYQKMRTQKYHDRREQRFTV